MSLFPNNSAFQQLKLFEVPKTAAPAPVVPDIKLVRTALYLLKEANISIEEKDYDRASVCIEDALDSLREIDND